MDAEKGTEVEMKELSPEVQDADKEKAEKKKEKKEEEGNVYSKLNSTTEDVYNPLMPQSSSKSNEENEKKAEEKEKKEEEGNVYSKLKSTTEDVYNPLMPQSSSKRNKENEKKAEEKETKEEEGNVYSKLKSTTEDVYNPLMPQSSSKRNKEEKVGKNKNENEEAEEDVYCKLNDPSENIYMSTSSPLKMKDVYKKVQLYKRICGVFILLFVLLLAVVIALAIKSNAKCPETTDLKCTCKLCQSMCPPMIINAGCSACEPNWGRLRNSCFFQSVERLNWHKSREACQKMDADLVIVDNEEVQTFLTRNSNMAYWIGLRYSEEQQWMWINNSTSTQTYWSPRPSDRNSQGSCALLDGGEETNNWFSNHCEVMAHYFCQKQLTAKINQQ